MEHELESHLAPADRHGARARVERRPHAGRQSLGADGAHPLEPARVLDVEISRPLAAIEPGAGSTGQPYRSAVALIRLHGQPLGTLSFRLGERGIDPATVAETIWDALEAPITDHLRADGIPCNGPLSKSGIGTAQPGPAGAGGMPPCLGGADDAAPMASVVVCTRDRPEPLIGCLESLLRIDYPRYELLVVDNAPNTAATRNLVRDRFGDLPNVRYLLEPRQGLSRARNAALAAARGEIIAFVDDDVVVDPDWLRSIVRGFRAIPGVACVTGMILPAELETRPQIWFEEFGGFNKGYERRVFDLEDHAPADPLYPFSAGRFGSGASMAFDREILLALGGFDEALGAGTPTDGAEDLDAYLRVILGGHRLVYEPRSVAWHYHRRDYEALRRLMRSYGTGLAALLTKTMMNPATGIQVLKRAPRGVAYLLNSSSPKNAGKSTSYPRQLTMSELLGALKGPVAYLRSRARARSEETDAIRLETLTP